MSKITELEQKQQVLKRPHMYIGKCENYTKDKTVISISDLENKQLKFSTEKITVSPLFMKLFDEALTNATDHALRKYTKLINITINDESIKIKNDGPNFEIKEKVSPVDKVSRYIPETAFSRFNSSSNYDDTKQRNFNGTNGVGIKLVNVFSSKFILNINSKGKHYYQLFENNISKINKPIITETKENDYVEIEYFPDKKRFKDITISSQLNLMLKRIFESSMICKITLEVNTTEHHYKHIFPKIEPIEFYKIWNSSQPQPQKQETNYSKELFSFNGKLTNDTSMFVFLNVVPNKGKIISYINFIETPEHGTHVKLVLNSIKEEFTKKFKTEFNKNYISGCIMFNCSNPEFSSQAKEKYISKIPKITNESFNDFIKTFVNTSGINNIKKKVRTKAQKVILDKLIDAEDAIKYDGSCVLFVCEGNSAAGMVDNAFEFIGHKKYGRYALTGKILNVSKQTTDKTITNKVISELLQVMGLTIGQEVNDVSNLRYGKVICVKDADTDGSDIMALCINVFYQHFKELLHLDFFYEFITPVLQIHDNKVCKSEVKQRSDDIIPLEFYSFPEYEQYIKNNNYTPKKEQITYLKGLASITVKDAARYFSNFNKYLIHIMPDENSDEKMNLAFGKKQEDNRKLWVERCGPETYLPRDPNKPIKISDFIEYDLVNYAYDDCDRSLINVIDGLKTSQRKILYTAFHMKQPYVKRKVFELGAETTGFATYLHGDASLNETIFGMMNDFTESNNIPLLDYDGQIGHRSDGGKNHGAPRYVYVKLHKISRFIFPKEDDELLKRVELEGKICEPYYYVPIIPMCLINGALGIGTGFKCDIPSFDYNDIIEYLLKILSIKLENTTNNLKNEMKSEMKNDSKNNVNQNVNDIPFSPKLMYPGYKGTFEKTEKGYVSTGVYEYFVPERNTGRYRSEWYGKDKKDPFKYSYVFVRITEFPIGNCMMNVWKKLVSLAKEKYDKNTIHIDDVYNDSILGQKQRGTYDQYNIIVKINNPPNTDPEEVKAYFEKIYKNSNLLSTNSMYCFNKDCQIRYFKTIKDIFIHFYKVRLNLYNIRKQKQLETLLDTINRISNKMKFVKLVVKNIIEIKKVKRENLINDILKNNLKNPEELIKIPTYQYTEEEIEKLKNEIKDLINEYNRIKNTSIYKMWIDDINKLKEELKNMNNMNN